MGWDFVHQVFSEPELSALVELQRSLGSTWIGEFNDDIASIDKIGTDVMLSDQAGVNDITTEGLCDSSTRMVDLRFVDLPTLESFSDESDFAQTRKPIPERDRPAENLL